MKSIISNLLAKETKLPKEEIEKLIEIPPNSELGDFAFPCFQLAGKYKKNPVQIATELANKLKLPKEIESVRAVGPYLNFFLDKRILAKTAIAKILKEKENFGKGDNKEKVMTEFCHANTHKAFHIGHTRNICTGESISRILEFSGNKVIRTNYQGDIGMHVAKTLWGLQNLKKLKLKEPTSTVEKGKWLGLVYAASSSLAKDNKDVTEEINKVNQKLYSGDKKLVALWKKTRKYSIDYFQSVVYPDFNVKFNRFYFESEVEKKGISIVQDLLKKKIAKLSDGAIIMDFEKENLGVFILLKSDGTPLYATKDLALAELQDKEFNPDKILHIVGSEQNLYFKQLIKTLHAYNPKLAKKENHLSYELVILPTGKMASREGKVILYDDTLAKIINLIKIEIRKRDNNIKEKQLELRAKIIALAAIKYAMLSQDVKRTIVFNEQEITQFEGNTGPYLQYTYARASSILKKSKQKPGLNIDKIEDKEAELIKKLNNFPEIVNNAYRNLNPAQIANYSFELCQIFNEFYHNCKVVGSEQENFRLSLVQSFRIVMKSSLSLLGIEVLEEM